MDIWVVPRIWLVWRILLWIFCTRVWCANNGIVQGCTQDWDCYIEGDNPYLSAGSLYIHLYLSTHPHLSAYLSIKRKQKRADWEETWGWQSVPPELMPTCTHTGCVRKRPLLHPLSDIHRHQTSKFVGCAKIPHCVSSLNVHDNP